MNIEKTLNKFGIIPTKKFEFYEKNYIAKGVAKKLTDNLKEFENSYNELYMRIYNCNMNYAKIPHEFGNVVYFYPNNTLYFDEGFNTKKNHAMQVDEKVIQEVTHYLQNFKKFNGEEQRIGVCNFSKFKINYLGLNEAIVQCIASKAMGNKAHRKNKEKISIYTISDQYYEYLTSLAIQLLFFLEKENYVKSVIDGTDNLENDIYNTFEEEAKKILNNFDVILNENNKINKNENKIIKIYLETQKIMCTTYFEKIYNKINTLSEVDQYTYKMNEYEKIVGISNENNEIRNYIKNMESKFNKKYIKLYKQKYTKSLVVVYQNKFVELIKKVITWAQ